MKYKTCIYCNYQQEEEGTCQICDSLMLDSSVLVIDCKDDIAEVNGDHVLNKEIKVEK